MSCSTKEVISLLLHEINPFLRYAQRFCYDHPSETKCPADCRILYVISGQGCIEVDGNRYPLAAGTLAMINAGFVYRLELDAPLEMIALNFDFTFQRKDISFFLDPVPLDQAEMVRTEPIEDCAALSSPVIFQEMFHLHGTLEEIINVFQTQRLYFREEAACMMKELLITLARSTLLSHSKTNAIANQLIYYLQEHHREELTSDIIAAEFNYHAYHINRIMRNATGTTVHKYLINYRIAMSKNLLGNTTMTIDQIAAEVGFKNVAYFSNSFKKVVGCCPSTYRARHIRSI